MAANEVQNSLLMGIRDVVSRAPTPNGRLATDFEMAEGLLSLVSKADTQWPRFLNVDHLVLIDADERGLVQQIELLIPASRWRVCDLPNLPARAEEGDLYLAGPQADAYDETPVNVWTDRSRSQVLVQIGRPPHEADRAVWLSSSSAALIHGRELVGLYALLGHDPHRRDVDSSGHHTTDTHGTQLVTN